MAEKTYFWGTGRRKSAVARVRICEGSGNITVNGKAFDKYFPVLQDQQSVLAPLKATDTAAKFDVYANVKGGGPTGQSGAIEDNCKIGSLALFYPVPLAGKVSVS